MFYISLGGARPIFRQKMGAEALVKFLAQRLDYLLSKETENFSGLSGQILQLKGKLDESGCFIQTLDRSKYGNESIRQWIRELRDNIYDVEDLVDQFITGANVSDESEKALLIIRCGSDLESIQVRLTQILDRKPQCDTSASSAGGGHGESSSSFVDPGDQSLALLVSEYTSLPYYLRSCLMYCCVFPVECGLSKGTLTRIWIAEGILQAKSGEILEDVAEEYIEKLVSLGLLETELDCRIEFKVPSSLRPFLVDEMMEENFIIACSHSEPIIPATARHVSIHNYWNDAIPNLNDLPIRSLFVVGIRYWEHPKFTFYGLKFLGLKDSSFRELPENVSNLRSLQTLDARCCSISSLSDGLLNCLQLRHLLMSRCDLPIGIGRLKNLQSVEGVYAGGSISRELVCLTQLRELGVLLNDHDVDELSTSIMKMSGLLSLTVSVSSSFDEDLLYTLEPFSPPPFLRKLQLEGRLVSLPDWLSSTENLTELRLGFSHLFENPNAVLQFLPNLKHLTLWQAYNAKQIGKEFCPAGGFPKLEVLVIASYNLVEWTEIEKEALPSLKYLHFHCCSRLMILPEGLQYVTTLQKLILFPLHGDHARRLDPERGIEQYKIKHIPEVRFFERP
ncbi:hypothetical protein PVL29_000711 [Vitis rotundifolia]|uniref:Rx N-terminal domain-containing protein n=1 Tax=Vitis rotundifolia TaxID=103349 RepID=A0AA39ALZ0_VITRO|nr:hypothetical protein PVL29_000711 [Vitis rotundifolia]